MIPQSLDSPVEDLTPCTESESDPHPGKGPAGRPATAQDSVRQGGMGQGRDGLPALFSPQV
jgi:hypothetical protein